LALLSRQRSPTPAQLVADGRDMGTVVFPDAALKFTFPAPRSGDAGYKQLIKTGCTPGSLLDIRSATRDSAEAAPPRPPPTR
jgi:cytidylate kinase